ncbi:MAG: SBBP repeat-containing protein [Thermoplasmatota archaeon]
MRSSVIVTVLLLISISFAYLGITEGEPGLEIDPQDLIQTSSGELPVVWNNYFTANEGQWEEDVEFRTDTRFGSMTFGRDYLNFDAFHTEGDKRSLDIIRLGFVGSSAVPPEGRDPAGTRSNFFIGDDPSMWASKVTNYRHILYEDSWEGVDMKFQRRGREINFEIALSDPSSEALFDVKGHDSLRVSDDTVTIGTVTGGSIIIRMDEGSGGSFLKEGDSRLGVLSGEGSSNSTIAKCTVYCTYFNGGANTQPVDMAVDRNGSAYITGDTKSSNLPSTPGCYQPEGAFRFSYFINWIDAYLFKLNPNGTDLDYCTYIGSIYIEYGYGVDVDDNGCAYIVGHTDSGMYPTTPGAMSSSGGGGSAGYATKFDPTGSSLIYSTTIDGSDEEYATCIRVLDTGDAYIGGWTKSSNFPLTSDGFDRRIGTSYYTEGFLILLNASGDKLKFGSFVGMDMGFEYIEAMDIDSNNNVIIAGRGNSAPEFPLATNHINANNSGSFILRMSHNSKRLTFSAWVGGTGREYFKDLRAVDDKVLYCGYTTSTDMYCTPDAHNRTNPGGDRAFVGAFNMSIPSLIFSTYIQNAPSAWGIEAFGENVVVGGYAGKNFPLVGTPLRNESVGGEGFIAKLSLKGELLYSTYYGGSGYDDILNLRRMGDNIVISGNTESADLHVSDGCFDDTMNGRDVYVARLLYPEYPGVPSIGSFHMGDGYILLDLVPPTGTGPLGLDEYNIYRYSEASGDYELIARTMEDTFNDTGIDVSREYRYRLSVNNTFGMSELSDPLSVKDSVKPWIDTSELPDNVTTGEAYNISIRAGDNTHVDHITMKYGQGTSSNESEMVLVYDRWHAEFEVEHTLNDLELTISAQDPRGNIRKVPLSIPVLDNDIPIFLDPYPQLQLTTGDVFEVSAFVEDNIDVSSVSAEPVFDGMPGETVDLERASMFEWKGEIEVWGNCSEMDLRFMATDSSNNTNVSKITSFMVTDNDRPRLLSEDVEEFAYTGDRFNFSITAEDNWDISGIDLHYRYDLEEEDQVMALELSEGVWSNHLVINGSAELLTYSYRIADTSMNQLLTGEREVQIFDNDAPDILFDPEGVEAASGEDLLLTFEVIDNKNVYSVKVEYSFGMTDPVIEDAFQDSGDRYSFELPVPSDFMGELYISIVADDDMNNVNRTDQMIIEVIDNIFPVVGAMEDVVLYVGQSVELTLEISDNIGIDTVTWYVGDDVWYGFEYLFEPVSSGEFPSRVVVLDKGQNEVEVLFNVTVRDIDHDEDSDGIPDLYEISKGFDPEDPADAALDPDSDGISNLDEYLNGTDPLVKNESPKDKPSEGDGGKDSNIGLIIGIIIGIVIIIAAVVLVLFFIMRKRTGKDEDAEKGEVEKEEMEKEDEKKEGPPKIQLPPGFRPPPQALGSTQDRRGKLPAVQRPGLPPSQQPAKSPSDRVPPAGGPTAAPPQQPQAPQAPPAPKVQQPAPQQPPVQAASAQPKAPAAASQQTQTPAPPNQPQAPQPAGDTPAAPTPPPVGAGQPPPPASPSPPRAAPSSGEQPAGQAASVGENSAPPAQQENASSPPKPEQGQ